MEPEGSLPHQQEPVLRLCVTYRNKVVSPSPNPQVGGPQRTKNVIACLRATYDWQEYMASITHTKAQLAGLDL